MKKASKFFEITFYLFQNPGLARLQVCKFTNNFSMFFVTRPFLFFETSLRVIVISITVFGGVFENKPVSSVSALMEFTRFC
jgi:hypothetical protein